MNKQVYGLKLYLVENLMALTFIVQYQASRTETCCQVE